MCFLRLFIVLALRDGQISAILFWSFLDGMSRPRNGKRI